MWQILSKFGVLPAAANKPKFLAIGEGVVPFTILDKVPSVPGPQNLISFAHPCRFDHALRFNIKGSQGVVGRVVRVCVEKENVGVVFFHPSDCPAEVMRPGYL